MKEKQEIVLNYYVKGISMNQIVKQSGFNWRTVKKYVHEYELSKTVKTNEKGDNKELLLNEAIMIPPRYNSANRKKRKLTGKIVSVVKKCLEENEEKQGRGQHKQKMKAIDIYEYLKEEGHNIGYTSIANLVKELKGKQQEVFIKQSYEPGDVCEFDWGEIQITIDGQLRKMNMAVFTPAYSNYKYAILYERQDMLAFQSSHVKFFNHIGGVYKQLVYDNMKVAVKKFVGPKEKEATTGLLQMSLYYLFDFRFCNVRRGNEKGHVERSVEYIRRKAFSRKSEFKTLKQANDYLENICRILNEKPLTGKKKTSAKELLQTEKKYIVKNKPPFEFSEISERRVDKYSTVNIYQNRYSIPEEYVGKMLDIKIYPEKINFYYDNKKICEHERSYKSHIWQININHYLKTLKQKPGALKDSVALKQTEIELRKIHQEYYKNNAKDFIELLYFIKEKAIKISDITRSINKLHYLGNTSISTDKIKIVHQNLSQVTSYKLPKTNNEIEIMAIKQLAESSKLLRELN